MKKSRLLNILCSMLVGVIFMIAMLAVMIFSGAVSLQRTDLVFSTESASAVYDGKPLTNHKWKLVSGELKKGHRAQVTVTGSQISSGESDNTVQVKILDAADADVTGDYTINYKLGKLKVTPRMLTVTSKSGRKDFDGTPLRNPEYEVNGLIPGHKAMVIVTGSQTEIGFSSNTIQMIRISDRTGAEVTHNYQVTKIEEPLIVQDHSGGTNLEEQDPETLKKITLYTVLSDTIGKIYLKSQSYGDYTGGNFAPAVKYTPLIQAQEACSASYLTSFALWWQGVQDKDKGTITIWPEAGSPYVLPYHMTLDNPEKYGVQTDDRGSVGAAEEYTVSYYNSDIKTPPGSNFQYKGYEEAYRKFVYKNYVDIDDVTREYMNRIIAQKGFNRNDPNIIDKVAKYMQSTDTATYSFDYNRELDKSKNIAIAFLDEYKEGVCKHYAIAATVLYRALGIPARYTEGVIANVESPGVKTNVSALNAHAWVEVYIDGFGWQMVEVTGGFGESSLGDITVTSKGGNFPIGSPMSDLINVSGSLKEGHKLNVEFNNMENKLGTYQNDADGFNVSITDEYGNDVTDSYNINKQIEKDTITLTRRSIEFESGSKTQSFSNLNGKPLTCHEVYIKSGSLMDGDRIMCEYKSSPIYYPGVSQNIISVRIFDENNKDVTSNYNITYVYGILNVTLN